MSLSPEEGESTDVIFTTGSFSMKAVVYSVFPLTKLTFTHQVQENKNKVVKIKEMKDGILKTMLRFAYVNVLTI